MFSYGNKFKITIYGASHEKSMGLIIDGINPGFKIDLNFIKEELKRRKPGKVGTTLRVENDDLKIKNGIFNGYTTGGPVHIEIKNENIRPKDYSNYLHFRPNHADFVANFKYNGFNDYRGGGFFSGRMMTLIVIAGAIAKQLLPFSYYSEIKQIGTLKNLQKLDEYLKDAERDGDSLGGIVQIKVKNMILGIGNPLFEKLDSKIAEMMMIIPGVRGIIFGDDFNVENPGSINNDLIIDRNGKTLTNHSGGVNGGISNGNDLVFNVYIKPTSSIKKAQRTFNFESEKLEELKIEGRHDVAFILRVPVVLECACAIVLLNLIKL